MIIKITRFYSKIQKNGRQAQQSRHSKILLLTKMLIQMRPFLAQYLIKGQGSFILHQEFERDSERNNYNKIRLNNKRKNIYSNRYVHGMI